MATDYSKMKNDELVKLLKERNLPHTGKKADMVARLVESDNSAEQSSPPSSEAKPAASAAKSPGDVVAAAKTATSNASATAIAAGGQQRVANPAAVPNQKQAIDPAQTADLIASKPASGATTNTSGNVGEVAEESNAEAPDFATGLAATSIDEELEKRRARAAKFGLSTDDSDTIKALERAKRFGTGPVSADASTDTTKEVGVARLDQALPERPGRAMKRGREDTGEAGDTFEDPGLKRRGHGRRFRGRSRGGAARGRGGDRSEATKPSAGKASSWMNESDRTAAEARKARWTNSAHA